MLATFTRFAVAVIVAALVFASSAQAQYAPGPCRAAASNGIRLTVEPRANHALIADATVNLSVAAPVYVEYGSDQLGWLRTRTTDTGTSHRLPIVRLRAETTYQARAFALYGADCPMAVAQAQFTTGQLPELLQRYAVEASGRPSFPLAIMDWRVVPPASGPNRSGRILRWLAVLDVEGHMVWYYIPHQSAAEGLNLLVKRLANGNWLYQAQSYGFGEVSPDARPVRMFPMGNRGGQLPHRDFLQLPNQRVLYIGNETRSIDDTINGGPPDFKLVGDTLHMLDLETGEPQRVWSVFEVLSPTERPEHWRGHLEDGQGEWTHANTVSLGPHGNILLSFRQTDQVISLSADLRTVEWKLGGPGSDFAFPDPSDRFFGQHSAQELPGGRILMFDNGNFRPEGEYSRALELQLDFQTMTAHKVWEYRHDPDIYSSKVGNVVRLPNGNTTVNFGFRGDELLDPSVLVEALPDGTAAWQQTLKLPDAIQNRYRVYPVDSLAGEQSVQPTVVETPS